MFLDQADRSAILRPAHQRRILEMYGIRVAVLVSSAETGGQYFLIEYVAPPTGIGPALHYHRHTEETFHVMAGQVHFQIGDERRLVQAGATVHAPAGVTHAFGNTGPAEAVVLNIQSPGGFDVYFDELEMLARTHPNVTDEVRQRIAQIADKYDVVTVGPPPGMQNR
jgi:quercetin dioxygenase-like cupin family protein